MGSGRAGRPLSTAAMRISASLGIAIFLCIGYLYDGRNVPSVSARAVWPKWRSFSCNDGGVARRARQTPSDHGKRVCDAAAVPMRMLPRDTGSPAMTAM